MIMRRYLRQEGKKREQFAAAEKPESLDKKNFAPNLLYSNLDEIGLDFVRYSNNN